MKTFYKKLACFLAVLMMFTTTLPLMSTSVSAAQLLPARPILTDDTFNNITLSPMRTTTTATTTTTMTTMTTTRATGFITLPVKDPSTGGLIGTPSRITITVVTTTTTTTATTTTTPTQTGPTRTVISTEQRYCYSLLAAKNGPIAYVYTTAYETILDAIQNYRTTVVLPYLLSAQLEWTELWEIIALVQHDYQELRSRVLSSECRKVNSCWVIELEYRDAETAKEMDRKMKEATDTLLEGITDDMPEIQRARIAFDRLVQWASYDYTYNTPYAHDAYGVLVDKTGVCESFARGYQHLLQQCGISACSVACGTTGEPHAITAMYINGKWWMADATWRNFGFDPNEAFTEGYDFLFIGEGHNYSYGYPVPGFDAEAQRQKIRNAPQIGEFDVEFVASHLAQIYKEKTYCVFKFISPYWHNDFLNDYTRAKRNGSLLEAVNRYLGEDEQLTELPFAVGTTARDNVMINWRDPLNRIGE